MENLSHRLCEAASAAPGPRALFMPGDDRAMDRGRWPRGLLSSRANSIMGGTGQMQRSIISEGILGQPREPR